MIDFFPFVFWTRKKWSEKVQFDFLRRREQNVSFFSLWLFVSFFPEILYSNCMPTIRWKTTASNQTIDSIVIFGWTVFSCPFVCTMSSSYSFTIKFVLFSWHRFSPKSNYQKKKLSKTFDLFRSIFFDSVGFDQKMSKHSMVRQTESKRKKESLKRCNESERRP